MSLTLTPDQPSNRCVLQDKGAQAGFLENQQTLEFGKTSKGYGTCVVIILLYRHLWLKNNSFNDVRLKTYLFRYHRW